VAVGCPGENSGDSQVWSLRGTAAGATTGTLSFGPATTGVSTTSRPRYGTVLTS
jgi:hypothetical protein